MTNLKRRGRMADMKVMMVMTQMMMTICNPASPAAAAIIPSAPDTAGLPFTKKIIFIIIIVVTIIITIAIIIILKIKFANFVVISKHHQTFLGSEILWAISPPLRYLRHPSIVWIRLFCSKRENTFFSCWCLWDDHHFSTHSLSYRPASRIMVIVIIIQCKDGMLVWVGVGANQYVVL